MSKKLSLLILTSILMIFFLSSVSFGLMEGLSTEDLTIEADIIVEGNVLSSKSYWSSDGQTIVTRAVVSSSYFIKGTVMKKNLVIEQEGGKVGNIGLRVSDVAPLEPGEKVILFLKPGKSRVSGYIHHIVGRGQGKYTIGTDRVARKRGFSIIRGEEAIDNHIDVDILIRKIQKIK